MIDRLSISFFWSKYFFTSRWMLWSLLWINLLGTIYGYQWYWKQMTATIEGKSIVFLPFVPDSPTASLFFTLSLCFLLANRDSDGSIIQSFRGKASFIRGVVEALAVITSVKYGIWAVAMIVAGAYQGNVLEWQDWMLMTSHLGMAVEVLLFVRFFSMKGQHIVLAALWTLSNDVVDYRYEVFPWLPRVLYDDIFAIEIFTLGLTVLSIMIAHIALKLR